MPDIEIIEAWLQSKGTTLWQSWDVTDAKERREAAEWFAAQQADLGSFYRYHYS